MKSLQQIDEQIASKWWRRVMIAMATLILCSCRASVPSAPPVSAISPSTPQQMALPLVAPCSYCESCPPSGCDCEPRRIVGPKDEYLCDGGDFGSPAGVQADWTVVGLEQEDTVAHYDTVDGSVVVAPSNRVCIYAPRFAAVRRVTNLMAHQRNQFIDMAIEDALLASTDETLIPASSLQRHHVGIHLTGQPANLFHRREQANAVLQLQAVIDITSTLATYANLQIIRVGEISNGEKPRIAEASLAAVTWSGDQAVQIVLDAKSAHAAVRTQQVGVVYETEGPNDPRLRLLKLASRSHALPGEEVEFTLRFDNVGSQVIGNVTIVDNLTTRLAYLPESAKSSLDAKFSTTPNDAGSHVLRWEINEPLEPGKGGILQFRCKVL